VRVFWGKGNKWWLGVIREKRLNGFKTCGLNDLVYFWLWLWLGFEQLTIEDFRNEMGLGGFFEEMGCGLSLEVGRPEMGRRVRELRGWGGVGPGRGSGSVGGRTGGFGSGLEWSRCGWPEVIADVGFRSGQVRKWVAGLRAMERGWRV